MSSGGRVLWWVLAAVGVLLQGLVGCGSRYQVAQQGGGEAPAVASGASDQAVAPAESKPAQNASAEPRPQESERGTGEGGGGLFRAIFEPLLSAAGGDKQADQSPSEKAVAAKSSDVAAGVGEGLARSARSPKPAASPEQATEMAGASAAPSNIPPIVDAASATPPSGSPLSPSADQSPAAPVVPDPTATARGLFTQWQLGQRVDLLAVLNRSWHVLGPKWHIEPTNIVSPDPSSFTGPNPRAVLLMPCTVPREFRWTVVAERVSGRESLNLFFALPNNRRTMVVLEGSSSRASGLSLVDGMPADRNETTYKGQLFSPGTPVTIVLAVRQNLIQVTCDGKKIIDFRGDQTRLTLDQRTWGLIPFNRLGLAIQGGTVFRITKLELEPLSTEIMGPPALTFAGGGPKPGLTWPEGPPGPPRPPFAGPMRPPFMRPVPPGAGDARPRQAPSTLPSPPEARGVPTPSPSLEAAGMPAPSRPGPDSAAARPLPPPVDVPAAVSGRQDAVCLVEQALANGTGFVIAKNLVATNAHVMEGGFLDEVKLHFSTPSAVTYKPKAIVYENVPEDLCFLEVAEIDRAPIPLVADNTVPRGQKVFIIGNPSIAPGMTARNTIGAGTVTTVMHIEGFDFYQIDGNVNPGSSGGPALSERGELVGVISMKAEDRVAETIRNELRRLDEKFRAESQQARGVGIAYSIPIVRVRAAMAQASKATEATKRQNLVLHHSRSLFQRAAVVAVYHTLRLEANVPQQVRDQAWKIRTAPRRFGPRPEEIELMPSPEAHRLAKLLETQEAREAIRTAGRGLKERLEQLQQYEEADASVIENLQRLLETAEKAEEAASNPPKSYQRFVETLKGLRNSLKRTLPPLAERLEP